MSDPDKKAPADEDLLEFLGGIDELNEDSQGKGEDFSDFLAKGDIDALADAAEKPRPPAKEKEHD